MKDIKYLKVPNVCFSLLSKTDEREEEYKKQRIKRGFDDSETWSLDSTIAKFIVPRLERYQEIANSYLIRDQELIDNIELFLKAMKIVSQGGVATTLEMEEINKGLECFPKIFNSLWW